MHCFAIDYLKTENTTNMFAFAIIFLLVAVLYLLFSNLRTKDPLNSRDPKKKELIWLLIGLLTIAALFSPKVREEVQNLRKKVKL